MYNTGLDANKKPDITIDYGFYQKVADAEKGEKFFNKTNPQVFSAKTLPPQFDPAMGHQLVAGQELRPQRGVGDGDAGETPEFARHFVIMTLSEDSLSDLKPTLDIGVSWVSCQ